MPFAITLEINSQWKIKLIHYVVHLIDMCTGLHDSLRKFFKVLFLNFTGALRRKILRIASEIFPRRISE
jgi:hypothetical protein